VTINLTPQDLRGDYLLYKRDRFIMTEELLLRAIGAEGLTPSSESLASFYGVTPKVEQYAKALRWESAVAK
jgi:biotin synthase